MILFGIKDKAMGFMHIFPAETNYSALRYFNDMVNANNQTLVASHPDDFSLFRLGAFEQTTGIIEPAVEFIEEGINLKKTN